jgi:hypothetical protein
MELRFLGQLYSTLGDRIETEASEQTGHFLGQKYQLRRPITTRANASKFWKPCPARGSNFINKIK